MKHLKALLYLPIALLLASCAGDTADIVSDGDGNTPVTEKNGVEIIMPVTEWVNPTAGSRSKLVFDYVNKIMKFSWQLNTDKIGVFPMASKDQNGITPLLAANSQQQIYEVFQLLDTGGLRARVRSIDANIAPFSQGVQYCSYFPVDKKHDKNYTNLHISYRGQVQQANVNMNAYFKKDTPAEMTTYLESEAVASSHLGAYDYLVSSAESPDDGELSLSFTRLGSIVRFYLKVPEPIIYDSLQVVNNSADFIVSADMDITPKAGATLTSNDAFQNVKTSHVVSLSFNSSGSSTFNLTTPEDNPSYRQDVSPKVGYIVTYMMFAPIDLKPTTMEQSTLYLCGHSSGGGGEKKYFRAKDKLSRITIAQNKVQQWAPTIEVDQPIEFEAITVEQWKNEVNGNGDGNGTVGW